MPDVPATTGACFSGRWSGTGGFFSLEDKMTNEIKLTEAAIEAWKDDIVLPMDEWKARGVALMRAGLPNAKLREAAQAAKDWAGRMSVADFRSKWNVHNDIAFWRVASGTFVHDMLDDALAAVPADQPHVKDCAVTPRQLTDEELRAVTTDVAKLTQERDEAKALHADLQATNIAMQADREHLHKRIEGLKADFDEAIQQRDEAVKRAEAAEKRVAELEETPTVSAIGEAPVDLMQKQRDRWRFVAEWLLEQIKGGA